MRSWKGVSVTLKRTSILGKEQIMSTDKTSVESRELSDADLENVAGGFGGAFALAAFSMSVLTPGGPLSEGCSRTSYSWTKKVDISCPKQ
jgi:hypothetical protein